MNDKKILCAKCGGAMLPAVEGSVQGLKCSKCGEWGYLTSYIPEIQADSTSYSISLQAGNIPASQAIKGLASVAQCNFLQAKRLLQESEQIIFTGNAEATLQATIILTEAGIKHIITPDFKYQRK